MSVVALIDVYAPFGVLRSTLLQSPRVEVDRDGDSSLQGVVDGKAYFTASEDREVPAAVVVNRRYDGEEEGVYVAALTRDAEAVAGLIADLTGARVDLRDPESMDVIGSWSAEPASA